MPKSFKNDIDRHAWETGWGRSLIETQGLSDRLERAFIYFTLGYTESKWVVDKKAWGDEPSYGPFMRNLNGSAKRLKERVGTAEAIRLLTHPDMVEQFSWVHDEVDHWFDRWYSQGLSGPDLAIAVGRDAERPIAGSEVAYGKAWSYLRNQVTW